VGVDGTNSAGVLYCNRDSGCTKEQAAVSCGQAIKFQLSSCQTFLIDLQPIMVLGLIALAGTIPMTATAVLSLQDKAESTKKDGLKNEWKTEQCHMQCRPTANSPKDRKDIFVNNHIVLRDGKLYVQLSNYLGEAIHPFSGYYLPYPDSNFEGLVSTISDNPPQLNWIYLDPESLQIWHGLRVETEKGLPGPWGARVCADGEIRFLWDRWEGFMAVETEEQGLWALCFDRHDNGLKGKVEEGKRIVELELIRVEAEKE
jgi:hypothetical protein